MSKEQLQAGIERARITAAGHLALAKVIIDTALGEIECYGVADGSGKCMVREVAEATEHIKKAGTAFYHWQEFDAAMQAIDDAAHVCKQGETVPGMPIDAQADEGGAS